MKKLLFTTIAAGMLAVSANAEAVTPSQDANGCYLIGTADELDGFTQNVVGTAQSVCSSIVEEEGGAYPLGTVLYENCDNRSNVVGTSKIFEGCVKLTADINYQGESALLKSDTTLSLNNPRQWSPIMYFAGSFDGDGHTIKGLYAKQDWEPSLIRHAVSGATIKNVNLVDSYFYATSGGAGSIVGNMEVYEPLKEKPVTIDKSSFKGFLYGNDNSGGLVGSMNANARLSVTNSFTEAKISGDGANVAGLVGYVADKSIVSIVNCYSNYIGTTKQNPLVGSKKGSGVTINAENVGCAYKPRSGLSSSTESRCYAVITDRNATYRATALSNLQTNYQNNLGKIDTENKSYDAATIENMLGEKIDGVSFNDVQDASGNWITVAVTLSEGESVVVPQKIKVGGVIIDRDFSTSDKSTIVLPFGLDRASLATNATFYEFQSVSDDWTEAEMKGVSESTPIKAHTPYGVLVNTADNNKLNINGAVTLLPTDGVSATTKVGDWTFTGTYEKVTWSAGDKRVYGFVSGENTGTKGDKAGDFKRAGKGAFVNPMRAYLHFDGEFPQVLAKVMSLSDASVPAVSSVPSRIAVRFIDPDPEEFIVESIPEVVPNDSTMNEESQGETQALANRILAPASASAESRWHDAKGRHLKSKPEVKGAFIKNGVPVIVK